MKNGRVVRRRIVHNGVVTRTWTPSTGWTFPEADRLLAKAKAGLARMQEIGPGSRPWPPTGDEPLDTRALWGAPPTEGSFASGQMGRNGPRNARTAGVARNARFV